ncbi:MAG: transporter related protein [Subtercola sp.]|nr:transporter related protein [Subtercola sp.]
MRAGLALTPQIFTGIWVTLLLALVAAGGRIVVPLTVQFCIDHGLAAGIPAAQTNEVLVGAVLIGAVAVVAAGFSSSLMNRRLVRATESSLATLRTTAFSHILDLSPTRYPSEKRGALVSRVTSDVDTVSLFTQTGGLTLVINTAQMILASAVMLVYSWQLALIVFAISGIAVFVMRRTQRVIAQRYRVVRDAVARLYARIAETILGADVIRVYGVAPRSQARVDEAVSAVRDAQRATLWPLNINTSLGEAASGLITATVVVLGSAIGAGFIGWASMSAGELVAFLFLITFFVRPLQFSVSILGEAQSARAGWSRVLEIIAIPTGIVTEADGETLSPGALSVTASNVSFAYVPGRPVLHDIDLTLEAGRHIAVVGQTGSGKTTFAKLLTRQLEPTAGQLRVNGVDLARIADSALARRVAIVPQEAFLFDRSVAENIAVARQGSTRADVIDVLARLELRQWADALPNGLDTQAGQRGEALSAGERQLVALARTALVDPDLLVLDEATSGVDPGTDVRVQNALAKLAHGRTTVTIAHRMVTAERADTILVFHDGRIVEHGPHDELVRTGGRYAGLYEAWTAIRHTY